MATRGGKRTGAGRKLGSGQYDANLVIRVERAILEGAKNAAASSGESLSEILRAVLHQLAAKKGATKRRREPRAAVKTRRNA